MTLACDVMSEEEECFVYSYYESLTIIFAYLVFIILDRMKPPRHLINQYFFCR